MNEPTFVSLFRGIGGFDLGLSRAGWKGIWSNDNNKYSNQIYHKHFPETQGYDGDIQDVEAKDIPSHDLLCGGFPCPSFSLAGKRKGFSDVRGKMFFEVVRIARIKQPTLLLLENVKGLLSNNQGRTFGTILEELGNIGYWCEWQVIDSDHFGVPQNRERVFIVGHLRSKPSKQIFPITKNGKLDCEAQRETPKAFQTLEATQYKGVSAERFFAVLTPGRRDKRQNGRRIKDAGEEFFTLTGQDIHGIYDGENLRYITPLECERMQGFPDGWTEGLSNKQRYEKTGLAVTVPVIEHLGKLLMQSYYSSDSNNCKLSESNQSITKS
jgi:DNA (cytosine-5)-methyltransferase 1